MGDKYTIIITLVLGLIALFSSNLLSQTTVFAGRYTIYTATDLTNDTVQVTGNFVDFSQKYTKDSIQVNDRIIDSDGNIWEVTELTDVTSSLLVSLKAYPIDAPAGKVFTGHGVLYRKDYPINTAGLANKLATYIDNYSKYPGQVVFVPGHNASPGDLYYQSYVDSMWRKASRTTDTTLAQGIVIDVINSSQLGIQTIGVAYIPNHGKEIGRDYVLGDIPGTSIRSDSISTDLLQWVYTVLDGDRLDLKLSSITQDLTPSFVYLVDSVGEISKLSVPEGSVVKTRGFYAPNDGADAEYLVRVDTLAGYQTDQRAIVTLANGLFAHLLPRSNIIGADQMGARVGDLATLNPSFTQAQLTYLRRVSWKALKGAVEYAVLTGNNLITLPAGKIEIDIDDGDPIQIGDDQTAFLVGTSPETSVLDVFPKFNWAIGRQGTMFYLNQGGNIELRNLSVINHKNASGLQTYHVTLKPASVANRINIDPAASLWSGIWSNLSVGDTIAWSIAANVKSSSYDGLDVVATIDSVAKFITLVDTLPAEVTDDLSNVDTYIGIQWPEGTSDDTVSTYSKLWWNADTKMFVVETLETFDSSRLSTLTLNNSDFFHVGSILDASQTNLSVLGKDVRSVDSWQTTFTFFPQDNPDHPGKVFMDNLDLSLSGMLEDGGILGSASGPSAGNRWGSGFYFHPNVPLRIENSYIYNNETGAIREYSGAGASSKRPNSKSYSTFSNTVFEDNAEYSLLTSGVMPTHYNNVKFLGFGGVYVHYNSTFQGCEFDGDVSLNSNNDPTTFAEERFYVSFKDCTFNEGANFDGAGWDIGELNRSTLSFQNCLFILDSIQNDHKISLAKLGVHPDSAFILIKDCFYKVPDRFQTSSYPNTQGQIIQRFINPGSHHVIIDNLQPNGKSTAFFDEWFFGGLTSSNGVPPKIEIKNSTIRWRRLMNTNVVNTWHLPPLIEVTNTDLHGGGAWQDIKLLSLPYEEQRIFIDSVFFFGGTNYDKDRWMENAVYSDGSNITLTPSLSGNKTVTTIWQKYPYALNGNSNWNFGHINPSFYGTKTITPTDNITVLPFSVTTTSNIVLQDTLFMKPGHNYTFRGNPFQPLNISDSLAIDTIQIATGDGSSTNIVNVNGATFTDVFIPGTMKLITDDGIACEVMPDGQVDCPGKVEGYVRNWNGDHYLDFTTAPTLSAKIQLAGTVVKSPLFLGYWTLEGSNDTSTVIVPGDNLGNHIATENLKMSGFWIGADGDNEGLLALNSGDFQLSGYMNGTGAIGQGLHFLGTNTVRTTAGIRPSTASTQTCGAGTEPWLTVYTDKTRYGGFLWINGTGIDPANEKARGTIAFPGGSDGATQWSLKSGNAATYHNALVNIMIKDTIRLQVDTNETTIQGVSNNGATKILRGLDNLGVEMFNFNTDGLLTLKSHVYLPNAGQVRFDDGVGPYIREYSDGFRFFSGSVGSVLAMHITSGGNVGLGPDPSYILDASGSTNAFALPTGTDAQHPTIQDGLLRHTTTRDGLEYGDNSVWYDVQGKGTDRALGDDTAGSYTAADRGAIVQISDQTNNATIITYTLPASPIDKTMIICECKTGSVIDADDGCRIVGNGINIQGNANYDFAAANTTVTIRYSSVLGEWKVVQ